MEYFKSGLKTVLGSQDPTQQPTGAEVVDRLVERVQSSTLLDDRRDACRAIRALSRKHRVDVGAQGMETLIGVLETDKQDCEIVGYALDALCNIMSPQVFEEEGCFESPPLDTENQLWSPFSFFKPGFSARWESIIWDNRDDIIVRPEDREEALLHVGEQFTEMFLKQADNVSLVLSFLEEYDFKVRWPALKLLTTLLTNRLRDVQEIILVSPMGVSKLMDLLSDSREIIRNDTLLLLHQLTKSNANIQKIVAFENAFDCLFDVIAEEGYSEGLIVVEDCLRVMLNLLKNNTSNQNFFKEGSFIQKLCPLFELPQETTEDGWSPQKVSNILCGLQVIRCLVSPGNSPQVTLSCQNSLFTNGIFQALSSILMSPGIPINFLTEAICTLSEIIRGNQQNQQHFSTILAPFNPPRESIVVLLMSMVNEKQILSLRCAVLYCFQCYLFKNEVVQAQIIQTLLPSSTDLNKLTCGQLLCNGMFSHDALSNWLSSVALSYALIENPVQKENLLKVLLAPDPNSAPITLIHQIILLLQQTSKVQGKLGFLILLSTWLSHCPLAVRYFVEVPTAIPYLTAQACSPERDDNEELFQGLCAFLFGICMLFNDDSIPSYSKDALSLIVTNRIGEDLFVAKISEVSKHEQYSRASKQPQPRPTKPDELILDYEFCKLFKVLESMIVRSLNSNRSTIDVSGEIADSKLVSEYKDVIRDQDRKIAELQSSCLTLEKQKIELQSNLEHLSANMTRMSDEITLLRAQVNASGFNPNVDNITVQLESWKNECMRKDSTIQNLESELQQLHLNQQTIPPNQNEELQEEIDRLVKDHEDLLLLLADKERKLSIYVEKLQSMGVSVDDEFNMKIMQNDSIA